MATSTWGRLKGEIWDEVAASRQSFADRRIILDSRDCKITQCDRAGQDMLGSEVP
jgi:hypothetical protein